MQEMWKRPSNQISRKTGARSGWRSPYCSRKLLPQARR
uniref:Uncharacterized protein n=1 Tax=Arundo donax TaxID=35708 RepID=A0A0A9CTX3_ARUDO